MGETRKSNPLRGVHCSTLSFVAHSKSVSDIVLQRAGNVGHNLYKIMRFHDGNVKRVLNKFSIFTDFRFFICIVSLLRRRRRQRHTHSLGGIHGICEYNGCPGPSIKPPITRWRSVNVATDNPSDTVSKLYNPSGVDVSYSTRHVEESWHHLMKSEDTAKFKQIAVCNFDFLLASVSILNLCQL